MTGTGASTPTRSCLKRKLQALSGGATSGSNSDGSTSSRNSLCKTVSFDGHDNIYFCDPDYDRHSVPVAPKLSYEDLLELKMLNVHMMCPQYKCAPVVPVGIMPLLPTSDSPSPTSANGNSSVNSSHSTSFGGGGVHFKARPIHPNNSHHFGRHNFVSLIDDDQTSTVSSTSMTPPPSSPSEHSPNRAPLPMIATDEEGQLIFQFSAPDELEDAAHSAFESAPALLHVNRTGRVLGQSTRRHDSSTGIDLKQRRKDDNLVTMDKHGVPSAQALKAKLATIAQVSRTKETISDSDSSDENYSPFPVPPSRPTISHTAALSLTPSFFTLPSPSSSNASSPDEEEKEKPTSLFPFAPPIPTTTGLSLVPPAMTMTLANSIQTTEGDSNIDEKEHKTKDEEPKVSPTVVTTSPATTAALNHNRSTSSSSSSISTMKQTSPDQSTPHASPTLHMRNSSNNTSSHHGQQPPVAGPLAVLQFQHGAHPRSPQLSGLPSPSLVPPSPLSLYPPSLDLNAAPGSTANSGFFPASKKVGNVAVTGHVKRASGSALARPTSPVVKPLKS